MNLNFSDKAEVNRRLRAILVKNWIDLGRITFQVSINGVVGIYGALLKLPGAGELKAQMVGEMIGEIESIQHVARVDAEFDNWVCTGHAGLWSPIEDAGRKHGQTSSSEQGGPGQTIVIEDDPGPI